MTALNRLLPVLLIVLCGVILGLKSCAPLDEDPRPVEDEGLFINEVYASGEDWLELYNNLEISKDISGYFIYDNEATKYKIPSGTSIPAKGFIVFICNDLGTGLNTNFKLTESGETVFLENASGSLIDRIEYPELSAGQSYGRYPDGSANLSISGVVSQGATNGSDQTPAIVSTARNPIVPGLNEAVTITATVANASYVSKVNLYHRFNSGIFTPVSMTLQGQAYVATIPAQATTGKIEYYLEVEGTNGQKSYEPATAPTKVLHYLLNTDLLPDLVINEFMAYNQSCCPDNSSGTAEYDDWIEIYNAGGTSVDIGGMHLSDNKSNPFNYQIPANDPTKTTIQPGGYLILWADNSTDQGVLHLDFALNNAGEDVGLYYIDGRKIDEYTFGAQYANVSWGRTTDGAATWKSFTAATPGASNQ